MEAAHHPLLTDLACPKWHALDRGEGGVKVVRQKELLCKY